MNATAIARRALATVFLLTGLSAVAAEYQLETVASGLHHPWSVVQLPDGSLLVTERRGKLLQISADGSQRRDISGAPATWVAGQGGYFDIVLHPDFRLNRLVYLAYAKGDKDANGTAIWRARLEGNALRDGKDILWVADKKNTAQHYGGRLLFLPDNSLLLATGDGFDFREQAQNPGSELGKVLRIMDDGSTPADNPFSEPGSERVWTLGHRNPQGLVLAGDSGAVYLHEHGPRGGDEVNLLRAGENYGWPAATHGVDYSGAYVSPFSDLPGMAAPLHVWVPSIAPSGMAWYDGDQFPHWRGKLLAGALVDKEVRLLTLQDGRITAESTLFSELDARIRDIRVGNDGFLYLLTDHEDGALLRVRPAQ
ncbi:MAG: PQQ-dependent sugar dehydrogenase [Haliea sp.]|uniref:PQQ-dependent sugar dehydrogenase n=1 Tax=Haliea sp. TaxID=1932666 RepID=UPI0032EE129E